MDAALSLFGILWLIDFVGIALLMEYDLRWSLALVPLLMLWWYVEGHVPE